MHDPVSHHLLDVFQVFRTPSHQLTGREVVSFDADSGLPSGILILDDPGSIAPPPREYRRFDVYTMDVEAMVPMERGVLTQRAVHRVDQIGRSRGMISTSIDTVSDSGGSGS